MTRQEFTSKFKAKAILEVIKEGSTVQQLAQKYKVRVQQIYQQKRAFPSNVEMFDKGVKSTKSASGEKEEHLLKLIGQQKVELYFLKNALR